MMLNAHTLIKSMVSHGLAESVAEDIVNNLASEERVNKLEESMIKPSEFTVAINKLDSRMNEISNNLRHDIVELKNELKGDIAKLDSKIDNKINETKIDILKWITSMFITNLGLIISAIVYFSK